MPDPPDRPAPDEGERFRRCEALFRAALDRPTEELDAFLEEECDGDEELLLDVKSLLDAHGRAGAFLEDAVRGEVEAWTEEDADAWVGQRIGQYRVVRRLGSGGMSTVLYAVRDDERFDRGVAIKVVRRGMASAEVELRFRQERRILAGLDHPNISRLLDAAATPDGRPAFVMEYVEGQPIDIYCDERTLGIDERIELFRVVCAAVEHAHQRLVVHRDLKPGNILVDTEGKPKLLDFGIAKILAPDHSPATVVATALAGSAMTPDYASPEQVRGETVTTASDVYALGLLLYELLTGQRPYRFERRTLVEIERVVSRVEAPKASTAVLRAGAEVAGLQPARLAKRLAGDLDRIVAKAIRKEPERRYASVAALSEDLRRSLVGLPVSARADTPSYRAARFVRRHRVGVLLASLTAAAVLASSAVALWQAKRATSALERVELERDRAEEVLAFMEDIFEVADPSERGAVVTAREILEGGATRIERGSDLQPMTRARLLGTVGAIFRNLGIYDRADHLLDNSVALFDADTGEPTSFAEALIALGSVRHLAGDFESAEELFRRALEIADRSELPAPIRVKGLDGLARVLGARGERSQAEAVYRQAIATPAESTEGELALASSLNSLGRLLYDRRELGEAESVIREGLTLRRRLLGDEHRDVANSLHNLAATLVAKGEFEAAEPRLREALDVLRRLLGDEHLEVAITLDALAAVHYRRLELAEAEALYREANQIRDGALGRESPTVARGLNNLAKVLYLRGELGEARALFTEALEIKNRLLEADHPSLAPTLSGLALVEHERGALDRAAELYGEAIRIRRASGAGRLGLAESLVGLGRLLDDRGDPERAEPLLAEGLEILAASLNEGDWRRAEAESAYGACRVALGDLAEGEELVRRGHRVLLERFGPRDARVERAAQAAERLEG